MTDRPTYRLVVDVAGPGLRDQIVVEDTNLERLDRAVVQKSPEPNWERYGGDDGEYVEVRSDYVVMRTMSRVEPVEAPADEIRSDRMEIGPTVRNMTEGGDRA